MDKALSSGYIARCHKTLKEWGAPLEGWICNWVYDVAEDQDDESIVFAECELCGCKQVRYVHVMEHPDYFDYVEVGCVCAGVMEGDILAAKDRECLVRNRAKRKSNFPRRKWKTARNGNHYLKYKGETVFINRNGNGRYNVRCDESSVWQYKGKPIDNFLSATYAAFDLIDPPLERKRL